MESDDSIWLLPGPEIGEPSVPDAEDHAPAMRPEQLPPGAGIQSRFRILGRLGEGGMGTVYEARDSLRGEPVAIKVLLPALMEDPEAVRQFRTEAAVAARLRHPHIVTVYDFHEIDGTWAIVMELLEGRTLREEIRERENAGTPFAARDVAALLAPLCAALDYAHDFTIHRDVKPENIWLSGDGTVKLMDFGLAKLVRRGSDPLSLHTLSQLRLGSPYYMAPEQLRHPGAVTALADQFAVGVIAYELLAGAPPVGLAQPLRLVRPDLPCRLTDAVDRALSSEPAARFPTTGAFHEAFRDGCDARVTWRQRLESRPRLRRIVSLGGAAVGLAGIAVATAEVLRHRSRAALEEGRHAQNQLAEARSGMRGVRDAIGDLSVERTAAAATLVDARAEPSPAEDDLPARLRHEVALARIQRDATVRELAWQWLSPRLDAEGRPDVLGRRIAAMDAAARDHRFEEVAALAEGLDEAFNGEISRLATLRELADSRLTLRALERQVGATDDYAAGGALRIDPTDSVWHHAGDDLTRALAAARMAEANAGREVRARFERIARDWIDADADWRSRFPEDPGPPPLEFLGFPQAKADVAREWAVLDRFDRALPLMQESRDIIAGWIRELEALENRCADSWSDALRAGRGYENLLGMRFVRFDGAYWSIWETRVMDFAWFAAEKEGDVRIGDFWKNPGFPLSPAHPVVGIDPALAHEFAHWLPGRFRGLATDGATCELPSRERFERLLAAELHADAARRALCPDPNELTSLRWITWYADPEVDAGRYILPVGTGEPSSHGLYDLRGNAWEWAAGFVFLNDANRRVLYGGGTFGDVSFHGSTPPDPETIFVGRPDAIGFRVLMPAETIDAALGREEPGR